MNAVRYSLSGQGGVFHRSSPALCRCHGWRANSPAEATVAQAAWRASRRAAISPAGAVWYRRSNSEWKTYPPTATDGRFPMLRSSAMAARGHGGYLMVLGAYQTIFSGIVLDLTQFQQRHERLARKRRSSQTASGSKSKLVLRRVSHLQIDDSCCSLHVTGLQTLYQPCRPRPGVLNHETGISSSRTSCLSNGDLTVVRDKARGPSRTNIALDKLTRLCRAFPHTRATARVKFRPQQPYVKHVRLK